MMIRLVGFSVFNRCSLFPSQSGSAGDGNNHVSKSGLGKGLKEFQGGFIPAKHQPDRSAFRLFNTSTVCHRVRYGSSNAAGAFQETKSTSVAVLISRRTSCKGRPILPPFFMGLPSRNHLKAVSIAASSNVCLVEIAARYSPFALLN
jgi:hypothetical protein